MFTNKFGEGIKVPLCRINCGFAHVCIDLASSIDILMISVSIFSLLCQKGEGLAGKLLIIKMSKSACTPTLYIYMQFIYPFDEILCMKYIIRISDDLSETQRMTV